MADRGALILLEAINCSRREPDAFFSSEAFLDEVNPDRLIAALNVPSVKIHRKSLDHECSLPRSQAFNLFPRLFSI